MAYRIDDYINGGNAAGNAMAQRRAQDQKLWADMLKMANANAPQTMAGFVMGKLLRGAYDHRKRRAAQKDEESRRQREQLGRNSAQRAGLAPTKGMLGNGFDVAKGFQYYTGGNNPIAWNAYGEAMKAQQPSSDSPVVAKTTEYVFDPNQQPIVQAAQGTPVVQTQEQLTLPEMAAQVQPQTINPNDIWKQFVYGRQG